MFWFPQTSPFTFPSTNQIVFMINAFGFLRHTSAFFIWHGCMARNRTLFNHGRSDTELFVWCEWYNALNTNIQSLPTEFRIWDLPYASTVSSPLQRIQETILLSLPGNAVPWFSIGRRLRPSRFPDNAKLIGNPSWNITDIVVFNTHWYHLFILNLFTVRGDQVNDNRNTIMMWYASTLPSTLYPQHTTHCKNDTKD